MDSRRQQVAFHPVPPSPFWWLFSKPFLLSIGTIIHQLRGGLGSEGPRRETLCALCTLCRLSERAVRLGAVPGQPGQVAINAPSAPSASIPRPPSPPRGWLTWLFFLPIL